MPDRSHVIVKPPSGRPCWVSHGDLPLCYLGWGTRDFRTYPVGMHSDVGTTCYLVTKGDLTLNSRDTTHAVNAPHAIIIDKECFFGISNGRSPNVEIAVWVWRNEPTIETLQPPPAGVLHLPLPASALPRLLELHRQCRAETERADAPASLALSALQTLTEVELARAGQPPQSAEGRQWEQVRNWIEANLAIHAPIPALCDYLGVSPSTLNRFFMRQTGMAPGTYFREAKRREALRLIQNEGWPVKTAAFHLGYRHATDLSRALSGPKTSPANDTPPLHSSRRGRKQSRTAR